MSNDDLSFNVEEKVNVLFKNALGFPTTLESLPWFQETAIKYNNYTVGENIFLDQIPSNPVFEDTTISPGSVGLDRANFSEGGEIKEDITGTIRYYKRLKLIPIDGSKNNSYYLVDTAGNNVLADGLQFNTKWSGSGDKPYFYELTSQSAIAAEPDAPESINPGNEGGNWFYDFKSGSIFFPDYLPSIVSPTNPPVFSFYKYIGRKGINKLIEISNSYPEDPFEDQILLNTDSKKLQLWNGSSWDDYGGGGDITLGDCTDVDIKSGPFEFLPSTPVANGPFGEDVETNLPGPSWKISYREIPNDYTTDVRNTNIKNPTDFTLIKQVVFVKNYQDANDVTVYTDANYKIGDLFKITQGSVTVMYRATTNQDDLRTTSRYFYEPWVEYDSVIPSDTSVDAFEVPTDVVILNVVTFPVGYISLSTDSYMYSNNYGNYGGGADQYPSTFGLIFLNTYGSAVRDSAITDMRNAGQIGFTNPDYYGVFPDKDLKVDDEITITIPKTLLPTLGFEYGTDVLDNADSTDYYVNFKALDGNIQTNTPDFTQVPQLRFGKGYTDSTDTPITLTVNYMAGDQIIIRQGGVTVVYRAVLDYNNPQVFSTDWWDPLVEYLYHTPAYAPVDSFNTPADGEVIRSIQFGIYDPDSGLSDGTTIVTYRIVGNIVILNSDSLIRCDIAFVSVDPVDSGEILNEYRSSGRNVAENFWTVNLKLLETPEFADVNVNAAVYDFTIAKYISFSNTDLNGTSNSTGVNVGDTLKLSFPYQGGTVAITYEIMEDFGATDKGINYISVSPSDTPFDALETNLGTAKWTVNVIKTPSEGDLLVYSSGKWTNKNELNKLTITGAADISTPPTNDGTVYNYVNEKYFSPPMENGGFYVHNYDPDFDPKHWTVISIAQTDKSNKPVPRYSKNDNLQIKFLNFTYNYTITSDPIDSGFAEWYFDITYKQVLSDPPLPEEIPYGAVIQLTFTGVPNNSNSILLSTINFDNSLIFSSSKSVQGIAEFDCDVDISGKLTLGHLEIESFTDGIQFSNLSTVDAIKDFLAVTDNGTIYVNIGSSGKLVFNRDNSPIGGYMNAATNDFSTNGDLIVQGDITSGRAKMGNLFGPNCSAFGDSNNFNESSYAFIQTNHGETFINCAENTAIHFRIGNNADVVTYNQGSAAFACDVDISGKLTTNGGVTFNQDILGNASANFYRLVARTGGIYFLSNNDSSVSIRPNADQKSLLYLASLHTFDGPVTFDDKLTLGHLEIESFTNDILFSNPSFADAKKDFLAVNNDGSIYVNIGSNGKLVFNRNNATMGGYLNTNTNDFSTNGDLIVQGDITSGRAKMGNLFSNSSAFGDSNNFNDDSYAFVQTNLGETYINCAENTAIHFRIGNNGDVVRYSEDKAEFGRDIIANNINLRESCSITADVGNFNEYVSSKGDIYINNDYSSSGGSLIMRNLGKLLTDEYSNPNFEITPYGTFIYAPQLPSTGSSNEYRIWFKRWYTDDDNNTQSKVIANFTPSDNFDVTNNINAGGDITANGNLIVKASANLSGNQGSLYNRNRYFEQYTRVDDYDSNSDNNFKYIRTFWNSDLAETQGIEPVMKLYDTIVNKVRTNSGISTPGFMTGAEGVGAGVAMTATLGDYDAAWSHENCFLSNSYAISQTGDGRTYINCTENSSIYFRINNSGIGGFDNIGFISPSLTKFDCAFACQKLTVNGRVIADRIAFKLDNEPFSIPQAAEKLSNLNNYTDLLTEFPDAKITESDEDYISQKHVNRLLLSALKEEISARKTLQANFDILMNKFNALTEE